MKKQGKILVVATSQSTYGQTSIPTGAWLGEITHFHETVAQAGYDIDIVSPKGGKVPVDPGSTKSKDPSNDAFLQNPELAKRLQSSLTPEQVNPEDYDALYFAGGHGTMYDFPGNVALTKLVEVMYARGKIVAAVCHGTAGLLDAKDEMGRPLISGRMVAGFSNVEEIIAQLGRLKKLPFLLQDAIKSRGAHYKGSLMPFRDFVITDGRLITGQNPMSVRGVAREVLRALQQVKPAAQAGTMAGAGAGAVARS